MPVITRSQAKTSIGPSSGLLESVTSSTSIGSSSDLLVSQSLSRSIGSTDGLLISSSTAIDSPDEFLPLNNGLSSTTHTSELDSSLSGECLCLLEAPPDLEFDILTVSKFENLESESLEFTGVVSHKTDVCAYEPFTRSTCNQ